jgi:NMD protein affecting ribosome stability and mRNA decay
VSIEYIKDRTGRNAFTRCGGTMRIKVRDEKITKAIKKLEGIDIILKTVEDAKKAIALILRKTEISHTKDYEGLKDISITQVIEHPTSAVEYQIYYEVEFILTDDRFIEMEIALIKELQAMFEKL